MFGSILSGQIISRTGRYRIFPVIGSGAAGGVALRLPLRRVRHPAVADDDRHAGLRRGPRLQLPAADPGGPERRAAAADRRRHLDGHLHPPDRRSARHRRVPVDPVLDGRREDHSRRCGPPRPDRRTSRRRWPTRRTPRWPPSSRPPRRPAARRRQRVCCRTARSSTGSTSASRSRSSWASPRRWTSCSSSAPPSWSSASSSCCSCPHVELRKSSAYGERASREADAGRPGPGGRPPLTPRIDPSSAEVVAPATTSALIDAGGAARAGR